MPPAIRPKALRANFMTTIATGSASMGIAALCLTPRARRLSVHLCAQTKSASTTSMSLHVLIKEPGTHAVTPWHHDLPYYSLEGTQVCSMWLPLDPIP
ncbi:MAG: hypothetical protein E2O38_02175 [Proteobacteria bacterium]|nr:MAG: hypothetical protein E2O38_02175 [Pseudomonadota bacterium]